MSQVISEAIAPAFLMGAVASYLSVLVTRLNRIIDRCRSVAANRQNDASPEVIGVDENRLNRRAIATLVLMITAFVSAFFEFPHARGVAFLFVVALTLFCASLVCFGLEVRIVVRDPSNLD